MAEKKGEGGGGNPRSSKSSTSSRKLKIRKAKQLAEESSKDVVNDVHANKGSN